ncbi:hypothetical protein QJS10_CPA06g01117 [Acorus calamus]|uniref:Uncharacterized protein n=1 Tax=Acorus calamus TaxID=4465 RepID=A0AAV9EHS4_ACOCL|nr:hypothetical protein QJS10_CPA06g01117 [Acorus calamus]
MPESSSIPGNLSQSSATSAGQQTLSLPNAFAVPSPLTGSQASKAPLFLVKSANGESQAPNHPPLLPTPSLKAPLMGTSTAPPTKEWIHHSPSRCKVISSSSQTKGKKPRS